jgi:hypothetical protein
MAIFKDGENGCMKRRGVVRTVQFDHVRSVVDEKSPAGRKPPLTVANIRDTVCGDHEGHAMQQGASISVRALP